MRLTIDIGEDDFRKLQAAFAAARAAGYRPELADKRAAVLAYLRASLLVGSRVLGADHAAVNRACELLRQRGALERGTSDGPAAAATVGHALRRGLLEILEER